MLSGPSIAPAVGHMRTRSLIIAFVASLLTTQQTVWANTVAQPSEEPARAASTSSKAPRHKGRPDDDFATHLILEGTGSSLGIGAALTIDLHYAAIVAGATTLS